MNKAFSILLTSIIKLYSVPVIKTYVLKIIDINSIFEFRLENFLEDDINNLKLFISDLKNKKSSNFIKEQIIFKYNEDLDFITIENNYSYKIKLCYNIISTLQEIVEHLKKINLKLDIFYINDILYKIQKNYK